MPTNESESVFVLSELTEACAHALIVFLNNERDKMELPVCLLILHDVVSVRPWKLKW